jgi:endogenous inhibitor of DNA gyrase (YacG/DUF329 family)
MEKKIVNCVRCGKEVTWDPGFSYLPPKLCGMCNEAMIKEYVERENKKIDEAMKRGEKIILTVPLDKLKYFR